MPFSVHAQQSASKPFDTISISRKFSISTREVDLFSKKKHTKYYYANDAKLAFHFCTQQFIEFYAVLRYYCSLLLVVHLLISWNFICHADRVILHALFKNSHFSNCISTTEFKLQSGINYLKLFANNCCRSWEFEKGCGHQGGLRFDEDFSMRFRRLCFNTVRRGLCEGARIDFSHHCSSQSLVIDR